MLVDVSVCGVECDNAVALIDDAEYRNCGCGPVICGVRQGSFQCVVTTVYCVVCVIEYGWYVGRGDCGVCGWKDRCTM